jgi:hypothetical protein
MGAQHEGLRLLRLEFLHHARPQEPGGAQLGGLHEEVHADGEEEGKPPGEGVDIEPLGDRGAHIFAPVGQREGQFLHQRRAGLLHVVAGNRDGVEARHLGRRVGDDVGHDPHRGFGRVDVGVADHELLEDVVLDGPREFGAAGALFLAGHDEGGEHRDDGAVHGHRHRHLGKRDAVEEDLHVLHRIDRHACLADIALDAGVVGIVAPMGGEIEGDRKPLLPAGERLAVEGIGFLGRGEAGILADGPGAAGIHGRARPAQERLFAGQIVEMGETLEIVGRVERLDGDALGRVPGERCRGRP